MAEPHVASALQRRRGELQGQIDRLQGQLFILRHQLETAKNLAVWPGL